MEPVIIVAPAGSGKSQHAKALRVALGCSRIVDPWNGSDLLEPGDLALTNAPVLPTPGLRVMSWEEAQEWLIPAA